MKCTSAAVVYNNKTTAPDPMIAMHKATINPMCVPIVLFAPLLAWYPQRQMGVLSHYEKNSDPTPRSELWLFLSQGTATSYFYSIRHFTRPPTIVLHYLYGCSQVKRRLSKCPSQRTQAVRAHLEREQKLHPPMYSFRQHRFRHSQYSQNHASFIKFIFIFICT
jgi:hypothetical protein